MLFVNPENYIRGERGKKKEREGIEGKRERGREGLGMEREGWMERREKEGRKEGKKERREEGRLNSLKRDFM